MKKILFLIAIFVIVMNISKMNVFINTIESNVKSKITESHIFIEMPNKNAFDVNSW